MKVIPLGDSGLLVRFANGSENVPEESLAEVLDATERLKAAALPGVTELVPAYTTVAVFFDPLRALKAGAVPETIGPRLQAAIEENLRARRRRKLKKRKSRLIEVPVCYEAEFASDLEEIARHANLPPADIIRLHTAKEYRVQCLGFTPGFPYLSGLDAKLATPRRSTPRKHIPAGSVGIGGTQTGIYPISSPGGWNVIGRTPVAIFDVTRDPPSLLQPGDRVRFRAITRAEFDKAK